MRRLHLRLRPVAHEPAHGAILRHAGRHGARSVSRFASSVGLRWREVMAGRQVFAVAAGAGLDADVLAGWSPTIDAASRTVSLRGEIVSLGDWSVASRRACPCCVAEDAAAAAETGREADWVVAHRAFLDVGSIGRCPRHRVPLVDCCPGCGAALVWWRAPLRLCPSGCDLGRFAQVGGLDVGLDAYLAGRLGIGPAVPTPVLDDLPFRRAVQFCERVGRVAAEGWLPRLGRRSSAADDACRRMGFEMAADWPGSLFKALDWVLAASSAAGVRDGLIARYGWIHPDWLSVEHDEVADLLRPLVRSHAVAHGVIARDEPILSHPAPPTVCLIHAAAAAGMGFDRSRRLLREGGVVPEGSRRGVAFAMDPAAVAAALGVVTAAVTTTRADAGQALGVGRSRVGDLLDAGLLDRVGGRVTIATVRRLGAALAAAVSAGEPPPGTIRLLDACRGRGVPIAEAMSRVVSGTLSVWSPGPDTRAASLLVLPRDLGPRRRAVSRVDAARRLGVHPQCLGEIVAAGAIATARDGGVDEGSLTAFAATHVTAVQLARTYDCSPRALIARLARVGVEPAFAPPMFRQTVFTRADLPSTGLDG